MLVTSRSYIAVLLAFTVLSVGLLGTATAQVSKEVLDSISTPNKVETSIGTLKFLDGAPLPDTAKKVYDYLDTARAADAFLKGIPGASVSGLIEGAHSLGAVEANEVMIFDKLMDAESLFLTGNSSTVYAIPDLDLKRDGPTVVDVPDGLLGAGNDGWFRFINNLPTAGKRPESLLGKHPPRAWCQGSRRLSGRSRGAERRRGTGGCQLRSRPCPGSRWSQVLPC